jgi:hypothetical protein
MSLHRHLVEEHADTLERDGRTYRLHNPNGEDIETSVETGDEDSAERFSNEVAMLVFDRLLDSIEG